MTWFAIEPRQELGQPGLPGGAEDELRGVLRAGEAHEGGRDVGAGNLCVPAAELLEELAVGVEAPRRVVGVAVGGAHMDAEQFTVGACRDAGGALQEVLATRGAGESHHDALAGLPRFLDAVAVAVGLQLVVDLVGHPQERQLAQCTEVAGPEVVGQRAASTLWSG